MHIIIQEVNGYMPDTIIKIYEDRIELEENNSIKRLSYNREEILTIIETFFNITRDWKSKYEEKGIIDDDIFKISVISKNTKEYYIKNKYPNNWSKFVLFRNRLVREELKG